MAVVAIEIELASETWLSQLLAQRTFVMAHIGTLSGWMARLTRSLR